MNNEQPSSSGVRNFTLSTDVFQRPDLDIYSQMMYFVLSSYGSDAGMPVLKDVARKGRMTIKEAISAMQRLVELKLVPHKLFRQMVGEFQDDRLSWAAKGLLTFCKTQENVTVSSLLEMSDQSGEDEHSIRKALLELKQHGYLDEYPALSKLAN
ncbi:hypothetical protein [Paenibacillus daejeonensis]|uniref:hypothetical protein n=1 Tax=Paenibacillus daejeonensis TaxID=135193 RepID=UPI00037BD75A|nr:hypothetical protein [Paenibacillus daejeonensis]